MMNPKEMPAPCKDEQTNDFQVKNSKFSPISQVGNCQRFGVIAARLLVKELHRQLIKNNSNNAAANPNGGADV